FTRININIYGAEFDYNCVCVCFTDVSFLHEWAAIPRLSVPYLSVPACIPAGVLSNPNWTTDELDKLITDRPENCRRKPLEPSMTHLTGCTTGLSLPVPAQMQSQPIVTLSLPCLPMHQHHQLQAQLQVHAQLGPMSPAPAQTPPLHTVPDLSHSPLTQQPSKPPDDFYSVQSDTNTEVDALDPSIMDFAFQGK
ncbi:hypothetical protein XENOCAPTIV_028320, partial [Xenoophorus captivus]